MALQIQVMSQQLLSVREVLNRVWDKVNHRLMTTPWVGAQQVFETETTILNDVWDSASNMLRVSSGGGGSGMINPMTTLGDSIVGGAAGTPVRVPLANQAFINPKLPPYSAVGDGVANDTAALQAALNDAAVLNPAGAPDGAGTVHLPPGIYSITFLTVPKQVLLQGSSMWGGGTLLRQVNGVNGDAVRLKCSDADGYYYGGVQHLAIDKAQPVTDTLGSGIGVTRTSGTCSLGESVRLRDLHVSGFPVSGIQVREGSAPLRIEHVSVFANGQFGVDLRGQHQTVVLDSISGDSNNTALINVDGTGSTYDATMIKITNVKAETNTLYPAPAGPQETVVLLNTLVNARVTVENVSATKGGDGSVSPQEIVRLRGSRPILTRLIDAACSGCVNMFVDEVGGFTLPWSNEVHEVVYGEDGMVQLEGRNSRTVRSLALGQNIPMMAFSSTGGVLTQKVNGNGVTLQTLTRGTDSTPTGNFVSYKTAAGVDVWNVDITGTLTVGRVPETRVVPQTLSQADVASVTIDCGLYSFVRIDQLSQATTFNAPTGCTAVDGQGIDIAIFSTTARALTFSTGTNGFSNAYGIALPTTSFAGQWVFYMFKWNSVLAKWVIVSASR
jgi:hypothetical protein